MTETLTGKRRFRAHSNAFGKSWLVLQVQVLIEESNWHTDYSGLVPRPASPYAFTDWRDARLTDLTEHDAPQHVAKRHSEQNTRLKFETIGFSLFGLSVQRALILQVRRHFYEYKTDPTMEPNETWEDAGVDDLSMSLEITS